MVMSIDAFASAFPAVHPLPVFIVLARNKDRRLRVEHALHGGKKIVAARNGLRSQTRVSQIHVTAGELGSVGVKCGECHDDVV
jgi:hypothetical protein